MQMNRSGESVMSIYTTLMHYAVQAYLTDIYNFAAQAAGFLNDSAGGRNMQMTPRDLSQLASDDRVVEVGRNPVHSTV